MRVVDCLNDLARSVVEEGTAPRAALGLVQRGGAPVVGGDAAALFDLASITKSFTAVAVARAGLDVRRALRWFLPELADTASAEVPLELFLAHRSGLAGHGPLYAPLLAGRACDFAEALRTAADSRHPRALGACPEQGFEAVYSDLGYLLAGAALARALGVRDAGEAIEHLVIGPLGIADEAGTVRALGVRDYVPTEVVPWRGGAVRGVVHDENAFALSGLGGSGHAGLFGTAHAVLRFGAAMLELVRGEGPLACRTPPTWMLRRRPDSSWRAGFDGKSAQGSSAGERASDQTFGHLGFTGTSLWIDPLAGRATLLLTNRVHPSRDNLRIKTARPRVHDALFGLAVD